MAKDLSRTWATIAYRESMAEDALSWLTEKGIPCLISPEHDSDVDENGVLKKPHFHILFKFDSVKSRAQIEVITNRIKSVGQERIMNTSGMARYLCHLDNPDKAQYDPGKVIEIGGLNAFRLMKQEVDKMGAAAEIIDYSLETGIVSLARIMEYARRERKDWFSYLIESGGVNTISRYLASRREDLYYNSMEDSKNESLSNGGQKTV